MFNGIVEGIGRVDKIQGTNGIKDFSISSSLSLEDVSVGESIAVNGVCLTVTNRTTHSFSCTLVPETLRCTNLDFLVEGMSVNLERSMLANARISGHMVQGHVDCWVEIRDIKKEGDALLVSISIPQHLKKYLVNKGYIAIDGMSITVIDVFEDYFTITLIPHTLKITIAKTYEIGTKVNIEIDMMAKYIEKMGVK